MTGDSDEDAARSPISFIIGSQFAQAAAAQKHHETLYRLEQSPLAGCRYNNQERCLWRWSDSPTDSAIAAILNDFPTLNESERKRIRDGLTMDDFYTLLTFVRRLALAALRSGDGSKLDRAFFALATIVLERIDWRDLLMASRFTCYAGQRLRTPVAELVERAASLAEPRVAQALREDSFRTIDLARECGYREVRTSEGVAIFQTGYESFAPRADLISIAFDVAVQLDDTGYDIDSVEVACDLPLVWLDRRKGSTIARAIERFSGCVSINGVPRADPEPHTSGQSLLLFLAEAACDSDAQEVAAAADRRSNPLVTQVGLSHGRLCAVIIQWSWLTDTPPLEDLASLERLRPVLAQLLADHQHRLSGQPHSEKLQNLISRLRGWFTSLIDKM